MIEAKVYALLSGSSNIVSAGGRIYPMILPQNPTYPAVTYQRIAGRRMNGLSGYLDMENIIVQVDVYADTQGAAIDLSDKIITTMYSATGFSAIAQNSPVDIYEDEIDKYRRSMDFSCWNKE
jgi:hypothetical protein